MTTLLILFFFQGGLGSSRIKRDKASPYRIIHFPEVFVFNVILKTTLSFETVSAQASFKLATWPRITLNSSSRFPLLSAEVIGSHQVYGACWG